MGNSRELKAFVRFDSTGRIIPGSLILRLFPPKVGNWKQVQAYECCDPFTSSNFLLLEDGDYILQEDNSKIIL